MELWLIEAVGKRQAMEGVLRQLGRDAKVYAVSGSVAQYRDASLGIAPDLTEPGRAWVDEQMRDHILGLAKGVDVVRLATDADNAGDVIAYDLAELLSPAVPVDRIKLRGIDRISVQAAIEQAGPVRAADAAPGRARAIVDRLLSATYAQPGLSIGRVATSMLAAVDREADIDIANRYTIVVAAADGNAPFFAEIAPEADISSKTLDYMLHATIRPVRVSAPAYAGFPGWHFGDALIGLSDAAAREGHPISLETAAQTCQNLYMSGRLSYPRSGLRGFSPHVHAGLVKLTARDYPASNIAPNPRTISDDGPHDSLRALGPVGIAAPGLATPEGILHEIRTASIRAANLWPGTIPDKADLAAALAAAGVPQGQVEAIASKRWLRWDGAPPPGMKKPTRSSMFTRAPDATLLDIMVRNNIGTPSSWPEIVPAAVDGRSALVRSVGGRLRLTDLGRSSLDAAPDFMKAHGFSQIVRMASQNTQAAAGDKQPWMRVAIAVMSGLPDSAKSRIRQKLLSANPPVQERHVDRAPEPMLAPKPSR